MTLDERWNIRYNEVKHRIEEHDMLNWVKAKKIIAETVDYFYVLLSRDDAMVEDEEKVRKI